MEDSGDDLGEYFTVLFDSIQIRAWRGMAQEEKNY